MEDDDYALYRYWLAQACRSNGVEVWSYCLLPNHVHLILVPSENGVRALLMKSPIKRPTSSPAPTPNCGASLRSAPQFGAGCL